MESGVIHPSSSLEDLQLSPEELEAEERDRLAHGEEVADEREAAERDALELEAQVEIEPEPEPDPGAVPDEIIVVGTADSAPRWAGKSPSTVTIKLKGMKFKADGSFRKGTVFQFKGSARVISEGCRDKLDKDTKLPSEAVQEHEAEVLDFAIGSE